MCRTGTAVGLVTFLCHGAYQSGERSRKFHTRSVQRIVYLASEIANPIREVKEVLNLRQGTSRGVQEVEVLPFVFSGRALGYVRRHGYDSPSNL